jgi:hypothetical protein
VIESVVAVIESFVRMQRWRRVPLLRCSFGGSFVGGSLMDEMLRFVLRGKRWTLIVSHEGWAFRYSVVRRVRRFCERNATHPAESLVWRALMTTGVADQTGLRFHDVRFIEARSVRTFFARELLWRCGRDRFFAASALRFEFA